MINPKFFKIQPWGHQLEGITRGYTSPRGFAWFFEAGTGKTLTCVNTLRLRYLQKKRLMKTLIFCPLIVFDNWRDEIMANSKISSRDIVILKGPATKRLKAIQNLRGRPCILVTNYEVLSKMKEVVEEIHRWGPEIMVLDESHRCKNHKTKQTREVIKLSQNADYCYLLTGSPILNSPMDIFSQMLIMDCGETLGGSFFVFRGKYFYDHNSGMPSDKHFPDWRLLPDSEALLREQIKGVSMHVLKEECLDLPPLVRKSILFDMSPDQAKAYKAMHKNLIAFIDDNKSDVAAVAELALTKALRLLQITTGFVNTEDLNGVKGTHRFKSNPRKNALKELLSDFGRRHKIIVWSVFKENYLDVAEVCDSLNLAYVEVHGGISGKKKMQAVDAFNNDDNVRVFSGHPGSGGIGINLVPSDISIFYSRGFNLEYDLQAEARNYRGGSEIHNKVTRIDLVAKGTIEIDVLSALRSKKELGFRMISDMVSKDLKVLTDREYINEGEK